MNLLIVSGYWPTQSNPISGLFVVQQLSALVRQNCEATVIIATTKGKRESPHLSLKQLRLPSESIQLVEVSLLRLPEILSSWPGGIWLNTLSVGMKLNRTIRQLAAEGKVFKGCLLHGIRYMGLSVPLWGRWIKGKTVMVLHGVDPFIEKAGNLPRITSMMKPVACVCHRFVLVGQPLLRHAHLLGLSENQLKIVANGTDLPELEKIFDHQRSLNETRRVVSISNLVALKGIDLNLKALARLSEKHPELKWEYRVIGDGEERQKLELLARELGVASQVTFLGRISYQDTMHELARSDVFSLPSWGEAFGIVYLEAMARARPVVGCFDNGAADIICTGNDGLLIPPHNEFQLTCALETLLYNPELCRRIGREGRKTAEKFSWEVNAHEILALLD
ncbi:MAG: glycosyltransferase [Akkermansiaceae bacterium]|nr:glycosyltransferase [Akkermansiaceae bacterium]